MMTKCKAKKCKEVKVTSIDIEVADNGYVLRVYTNGDAYSNSKTYLCNDHDDMVTRVAGLLA